MGCLRRHNAPSEVRNSTPPQFPYNGGCSLQSPQRQRVKKEEAAAASARHKNRKHDYWCFFIFNRRADSTDVAITQIPALWLRGTQLWIPDAPLLKGKCFFFCFFSLLFGCQKCTRDNVTAGWMRLKICAAVLLFIFEDLLVDDAWWDLCLRCKTGISMLKCSTKKKKMNKALLLFGVVVVCSCILIFPHSVQTLTVHLWLLRTRLFSFQMIYLAHPCVHLYG